MKDQKSGKGYTDLSVGIFREKMKEEGVVVLDVRTAAEVAERQIEGAVAGLDFYNGEFESRFPLMDRDKTYLIYCRSGVRSVHACEMMAAAGFEKLYNLKGGIIAWVKEGG